MRPKVLILLISCTALASAALSGCSPSNEEIAVTVKPMLQSKLDESSMKEYHLRVDKIDVMHESGNKYQGIATISENGQMHTVILNILVDGEKIMFATPPDAFSFVVTDALQRAAAQASRALSDLTSDLLRKEGQANEKCRGGSGDDPQTVMACAERDALMAQLKGVGKCYGPDDAPEAAKKWGACP